MFYINRNPKLENISVTDLYLLHKKEQLDESPYYQRFGDLWSLEKKRLLIDTIINGYDIPKFYFHYIVSNDNELNLTNKTYAIIDGKQRLNTLVDFIENNFALDETVIWLERPELKLNKIKYSDLEKKNEYFALKNKIDNFQLNIIHITTDEFERIEEMFLRLNDGVPVNNAEKRNSIGGFLIDGINKLVKNSSFLKNNVRFGNKRMEHQDLIAKLCLIETSDAITSYTKKNLDDLVKKFKVKRNATENDRKKLKSEANDLLDKVNERLNLLRKLFDEKDPLLRSKGTIPLYYLFLKKYSNISKTKFKEFLINFDIARSKNRKIGRYGNLNTTLMQFDRLNQQGAHQAKSLEIRLNIMNFYFEKGTNKFDKEMSFNELGLKHDDEDDSI